MMTFSRSMLVGAEFPDEQTVRFHGILEDHIYAMEIEMDVQVPEGVISGIKGWMKRYTNPVCPKAEEVLQGAVGMSVLEEGWMTKVYREIGRKGCQHFAEILIECGRCLAPALMAKALSDETQNVPLPDQDAATVDWVNSHKSLWGGCLAVTGEGG